MIISMLGSRTLSRTASASRGHIRKNKRPSPLMLPIQLTLKAWFNFGKEYEVCINIMKCWSRSSWLGSRETAGHQTSRGWFWGSRSWWGSTSTRSSACTCCSCRTPGSRWDRSSHHGALKISSVYEVPLLSNSYSLIVHLVVTSAAPAPAAAHSADASDDAKSKISETWRSLSSMNQYILLLYMKTIQRLPKTASAIPPPSKSVRVKKKE